MAYVEPGPIASHQERSLVVRAYLRALTRTDYDLFLDYFGVVQDIHSAPISKLTSSFERPFNRTQTDFDEWAVANHLYEEEFPKEIKEQIYHESLEFEIRIFQRLRHSLRSYSVDSLIWDDEEGEDVPSEGEVPLDTAISEEAEILFDFNPDVESLDRAVQRIRGRFESELAVFRRYCLGDKSEEMLADFMASLGKASVYFDWLALRQLKGMGNTAIAKKVGRETSLVQYGITAAAKLMGLRYKDLRKLPRGRPPRRQRKPHLGRPGK